MSSEANRYANEASVSFELAGTDSANLYGVIDKDKFATDFFCLG